MERAKSRPVSGLQSANRTINSTFEGTSTIHEAPDQRKVGTDATTRLYQQAEATKARKEKARREKEKKEVAGL